MVSGKLKVLVCLSKIRFNGKNSWRRAGMSEAFSTFGFSIMMVLFAILGYILNKVTGA